MSTEDNRESRHIRLEPDGEPAEIIRRTEQGHQVVRILRTGSYGLVADHEIQPASEAADVHTV